MNAGEASTAEVDLSKYTILIIDDNPTNLGVIFDYLKQYGFKILAARDGESGLKRAEYAQPDIILLDVMMPGIDGFETCKRLKASTITQDIPVIFMTALVSTEDKVKGFEAGAVDYVTKPLQQEEVLARLTTHLRIRNLTHDLLVANTALSKRATQLQIGNQVGQQITSILDLNELLDRIVNAIQTSFGYYMVSVWLLSEWQNVLTLHACKGLVTDTPCEKGKRVPIDELGIISEVCKTGLYHLSQDVLEDPAYKPLQEWPQVRSELALPMRMGHRTIGVLDILSDQPKAFGADDQMVLQTLANQIAIAIRNAQLYKSEQYRRQVAEALEQTGRALSGSLALGQMPERILEQLAAVMPYARGSVMLRKDDTLHILAQRGFPSDEQARQLQMPIRPGDVFQHIMDTNQPLIIDDVAYEPGFYQIDWLPVHKSWMGVPLIRQERVVGMVSLTRPESQAFTREDANLVLTFAAQAAVALENALLYDEITRLNEHLEQMVQQRTEELQHAYRTLEKLDKTKSDFIEIAAHELRTPLTLIKGYAQLLSPMLGKSPEAAALVEGILTGQTRLLEVINSMLDVSRISGDVLQVDKKDVYILNIIRTVWESFETTLEERHLKMNMIDLDNLPPICADPDLLQKLFYHLIVNAIKYTPDGGSITISGQIVIEASGRPIEIIVSDTGIGIAPDHQEVIFEKFYQSGEVSLHSSGRTKFKGGGPGLGLAIAKGIVSAHGGKIWVESEGYDEKRCPGSRFHVVLPVHG